MGRSRKIPTTELRALLEPHVGAKLSSRGADRVRVDLHRAIDPAYPETEWAHYRDADIRELTDEGVWRFSYSDTHLVPWGLISRVVIGDTEYRVTPEAVAA